MKEKAWLSSLFVLFPILIIVVGELNKTNLIWNIRVVDFLDLTVIGPFYAIMFFLINKSLGVRTPEGHNGKVLSVIGFIGVFLFFEGHGLHLAANSIDTFSFEINTYQLIIPKDTKSLIHFFDEILGHSIMFLGLFFLITYVALKEAPMVPIEAKFCRYYSYVLGGFYGISLAVAFIESQYFIYFLLIYSFLMLLYVFRKNKKEGEYFYYSSGLKVSFISVIATTVVYFLIFGGFIEPSKM